MVPSASPSPLAIAASSAARDSASHRYHGVPVRVLRRPDELGRHLPAVEIRHPKLIQGPQHRAGLRLLGVPGLARLGDALRQDGRRAALHAVQVLQDLGHGPRVAVAGPGLPAVGRNGGSDVEQGAALERQMLGELGESRMHRSGVETNRS